MMMVESERKRERGGRENGVNVRGNEKGRKIVRVSEREREKEWDREKFKQIERFKHKERQRERKRLREIDRDIGVNEEGREGW